MPSSSRLLLCVALAACLTASGCRWFARDAAPEQEATPATPAAAPAASDLPDAASPAAAMTVGVKVIPEAFVTRDTPVEEIDSVTTWEGPGGALWLIATGKESHRLIVYDGNTGSTLRTFGGKGEALGQFNRPNGIGRYGDLLFVVERDNHRVQVLRLPSFEAVTSFGDDHLRSPYGLWLRSLDADTLEVLVTDSYIDGFGSDGEVVIPPLAQLGERIKRFHIELGDDGSVRGELVQRFGDTSEAGALRIVESLVGDPMHDRLLISEEDLRVGTELREYSMDGRYRGRDIAGGDFQTQSEGMALYECPDGSGYWIATDQGKERSVFHVYDRVSLAHLGAFAGQQVANTDGVALHPALTAKFPFGVFYAVHDDQGAGAFDWADVARALNLRLGCPDRD